MGRRVAFAMWLGAVCLAQAPVRFDAASVRPSEGRETLPMYTPGRVHGNLTLRRMILEAYHIGPYQLSGGPSWMNSDLFAMEAKAAGPAGAGPASKDELRVMLQTLLAERFKLVVRRESKKMPVYELRIAKGGAKLREIKPGDPVPTPQPANPSLAHVFFVESMHDFVDRLNSGDSAGRPVVDRTGLSGIYVFDFLAHNSADLVESIEDQSGLRFEPSKAPMDMVTIEHAERPDPD